MVQKIHLTNLTDIVLEKKRESKEEFFINLFEYCNLACSFCWQDHDSEVGMDRIIANAHVVNKIIDSRPFIQSFDINIMGGELFCDEIEDELFGDYLEFTRIVNAHVVSLNKQASFGWVTNLVYKKTERVTKLIDTLKSEGMDTCLITSYDPSGRFNPETRELFFTNLKENKEYVRSISMVITKPNIKHILKDTDKDFHYLYDNHIVFFDYYSPEKNAEKLAPSDKELLQLFYFLIDKYPEVQPVTDWINKNQNGITCRSSNIILPTGSTGKCRKLVEPDQHDKFETPISITSNQDMEETFITRHNCLECEYFQRCGLGCFLHSDFLPRERMDECVFKLTFDYITKGDKRDDIY